MRIWDVDPRVLCRQHLLGEHRELHAVWAVLTENRRGYRRHPETLRWEGRLRALARRHELLVAEMRRRRFYDPTAVPLLIAPLLAGRADMTFGSRFAGLSDPRGGGMPL